MSFYTLDKRTDFASFPDYLDAIERTPTRGKMWGLGGRNDGNERGTEWAGTKDLPEALDIARHGWPEGRALMSEDVKVAEAHRATGERQHWKLDIAGAFPIVPAFLTGRPDHMVRFPAPQVQKKKPIIRIIVERFASAIFTADQLRHYGAALLSHVDQLEEAAFSVELSVAFTMGLKNAGQGVFLTTVNIKQAGEPLDLDRAAFVLAHPSMFRRLQFRWNACNYAAQKMGHHGYPRAMQPEWRDEDAMYLPGVNGAGKWDTIPSAMEGVRRQLELAAEDTEAVPAMLFESDTGDD